jgi:hypothetical protein
MERVLQHLATICEQILDHVSVLNCFVPTDLPIWTWQTTYNLLQKVVLLEWLFSCECFL